ncbi:MAG: DUF6456 domain-containing protein [Bosea sp. (in: a-proteobacteria)]
MSEINAIDSAENMPGTAQQRLLRHFAQAGAFAMKSSLSEQDISLYRSCGSITLGAGTADLALAHKLVAQGFLRWKGEGASARLLAADPQTETPALDADSAQRALGHAQISIEGRQTEVVVNMLESPLAWLHRRKDRQGRPQISAAAFAAGERFRADVTLAQMLPRITSNWSAAISSGRRGPADDPASASEAVLAARQRVRKACDILGPESSGLVLDVCAFLKRLEQVEIERGWPVRSAKLALRLALDRLADHYGLVERVTGSDRQRTRVWQAPDARPSQMPPL